MSKEEHGPICLNRIDPAQNMRRFYSLTIQPTLFGGVSIMRNWGRIGTRGQAMMQTFDDPQQAAVALERLACIKRSRGYCDHSQTGGQTVRRGTPPFGPDSRDSDADSFP
ncbi:WGR domain-containing protein [Paenirhodobacter populi]|uniref:WGR domain-containing protein n=1 Tax=Paenirhodobacter populi TaxID=2306993 RepID=A0A443JRH2_9RHOB|nr:WGR domain-containing protein [Sinirhodobacter populi]RWR23114.1 WGR domain-containing protein [Sinirhodobacter populi]